MTKQEEEFIQQELAKEKSFIGKLGAGNIITLVTMIIMGAVSYGAAKYQINDMSKQIEVLQTEKNEANKNLAAINQRMSDFQNSLNEVKEQNRQTYQLLFDFSRGNNR